MTRRTLLDEAIRQLEAAGVEGARRNATWLLETALGQRRALSQPSAPVPDAAAAAFREMVARRATREPVQYVMGEADFYGLTLHVTPAVLIPRPETEEVAEAALRRLPSADELSGRTPWVLDVGTGSGALALAIKHERPDAEVVAADVSPGALAVARENAERLELPVTFVHADALRPAFADGVPALFDCIVSNPPYVPAAEGPALQPEVRDHEPALALFVAGDPLVFYRALAGHACRLLRPGGHLVVETHADHGRATADLLAETGMVETAILRDMAGRERIAVGQARRERPA
jgi:release factor glutamine methyltransferase